MLRLKEVASQFESFSKRVWKNKNAIDLCCFPGPPPAGRLNSFLLTGRLYWLLYADLSPIGIQTHKSDTDDKHKEPADKKIDRQPAGG